MHVSAPTCCRIARTGSACARSCSTADRTARSTRDACPAQAAGGRPVTEAKDSESLATELLPVVSRTASLRAGRPCPAAPTSPSSPIARSPVRAWPSLPPASARASPVSDRAAAAAWSASALWKSISRSECCAGSPCPPRAAPISAATAETAREARSLRYRASSSRHRTALHCRG
eukprot:scaffold8611_cov108-Isochrysis_galbana.AAC.6